MFLKKVTVAAPESGTERAERAERALSRPRGRGRFLRVARSVHRYTGLLLLPWLLFFGLSGVLFNHPNLGEKVSGQRIAPRDLAELSRFQPWRAEAAAREVIERLNRDRPDARPYSLDGSFDPHFTGYAVLGAPAPDGNYMMILDVERASGVLVHRAARKSAEGASFPARELELPEYSSAALEQHARGLLAARDLPHERELRAHPKIAPELRLRAVDGDGVRWNLTYDARTGEVSGRRADRFPNLGVAQLLGSMHKTHHFPLSFGALWLWALFEDLLGAAMVLWALTGMAMWWQMKRTRVAGAVSLALAIAVAAFVMSGTLDSLTFGDVRAATGPGE